MNRPSTERHSPSVAIIGCGYLGLEVAAGWSKKGYRITATTRTPDRLTELSQYAQKSLILRGDPEEYMPIISANEALLISVAADAPEHYETTYLQTAQIFRQLALEMDLPRDLIYTSSTSVYGNHRGLWVDETSSLKAKGVQAKVLIETEKTFTSLEELGWNVCIFRLGEIYGPGREISERVRHLEGQVLPGAGDHYTNMIHKTDCALAIDYAMRYHLRGTYNLADDDHPTRKELYDQVSKRFHLPPVKWDPSLTGIHHGNKRVSNHKIKAEGFTFTYPHRVLD